MRRTILEMTLICGLALLSVRNGDAYVGGEIMRQGTCSISGGPCLFATECPMPFEECNLMPSAPRLRLRGVDGEASPVQSCFYDCRTAKVTTPATAVSEDTLLPIVNESATFPIPPGGETLCACILLYDAHENLMTVGLTELSPQDNDTINVCSVLGAGAPASGTVEILTSLGPCAGFPTAPHQGGAYAWIKNVTYKGRKRDMVDPFSAKVLSVAKTECRVTPEGVAEPHVLHAFCNGMGAPMLPMGVYVDDTFE